MIDQEARRQARFATHHTAWKIAFDYANILESVRIYPDGSAFVELEGIDEHPPSGIHEYYPVQLPEKLQWINSELEAAGWPAMSPWWEKRLARLYTSNWIARDRLFHPEIQRRSAVWRVARRGGKSSTICRVAVFECVFGEHEVPPGDIGIYAVISAERPQAKERVNTIKKICDVLRVDGKEYAESFEFKKIPRAIRCFTASITSVVSFTCIGAMCDEEAIWRDTETGTNPAKEVLASLRPTMATMRNAVAHHVSAPWSTLDEHAKAFDRGTTADQIVFGPAATWEANPTLTEAETHILEPDETMWLRAYCAVPLASDETKFFNAALIDRARHPDSWLYQADDYQEQRELLESEEP